MKNRRTPFKSKPLRNPGQSLDEAIQDNGTDILLLIVWLAFTLILVFVGWSVWLRKKPENPIALTIISIPIVIFCVYKIITNLRKISRLRMARDGEKLIGQFLESLRKDGALVFHDIISERGNIDHVVLSRRGFYTIETKSISKPSKGQTLIQIQGDKLVVNGKSYPGEPLAQARAEATWLKEFLLQSTGKKFPIKPVILIPDWYVEPRKGKQEVWVLNQQALPSFIAQVDVLTSEDDLHLASYHLSRYVQTRK